MNHPSDLSDIRPTWVKKIDVAQVDGVSVAGPCWLWRGAVDKGNGYGKADTPEGRSILTHRYVYQQLVGAIPEGLELDHLCRQRACCAPHHMEPVTHRENIRRGSQVAKTHCKPGGHPLSGDNLYVYQDKNGHTHRFCRACHAKRELARYAAGKRRPQRKRRCLR